MYLKRDKDIYSINGFSDNEIWEKYRKDIDKRIQTYYREAVALIPEDVESILDIGCGEGSFLNILQGKYFAVGIDVYKPALSYLKTHKIQGDAARLPFRDLSFDAVSALEVLEHLKRKAFFEALSEIKRVAQKYIIISVPNEEPLDYFLVVCPECGCHFNAVGHVRSFDIKRLKDLFLPEFSFKTFRKTGNVEYPTYSKVLFGALRSYVKPKPPLNSMCPQCGYKVEKEENRISYSKMPASLRCLKRIADLIWRPKKKNKWLVAIYERV